MKRRLLISLGVLLALAGLAIGLRFAIRTGPVEVSLPDGGVTRKRLNPMDDHWGHETY